MNVFNLFRRRGSAPVARERLQILLSYERAARGQSDLLAVLREDILAALTKHITVERENVQVSMDRGENVSTLCLTTGALDSARLRCLGPFVSDPFATARIFIIATPNFRRLCAGDYGTLCAIGSSWA